MAFGFGFDFSKQASQQASESGVAPYHRQEIFTPARGIAEDIAAGGRSLMAQPIPTLPTLSNGFLPQQLQGVNTLFRDAISRSSGMGGARGQLSPENTGAVFGSALQNIAPTLLSMIKDNILQSIFMPEQIKQQRYSLFSGAANPLLTLATSGSTGAGSSSGFGIGVKGGDNKEL